MCTDSRIQTYSVNDFLGIKSLALSIGIQFIEVGYSKSQIGVSKKFYCLRLGIAHEQDRNIFFDGALI